MTDAESFYLILVGFYLLECFKFCPPNSMALRSPFFGAGAWSFQPELLRLLGINKWVFQASLIPWPQTLAVLSPLGKNGQHKINTVLRVGRCTKLINKATRPLRLLSLSIFIAFIVVLPLAYYARTEDSHSVLIIIVIGYIQSLAAAVIFFRLHRRLFPKNSEDRFKSTLFTAFLPWHAMRAADEIVIGYTKGWCPIATLAANAGSSRSKEELLKIWRQTQFLSNPNYPFKTLSTLLNNIGFDTEDLLIPFDPDSNLKHCPRCLSAYEGTITHCGDCRGIKLV